VSRKTGVMLNPIMDVNIRQIKDSRPVVPTEDSSNRVWNVPTEGWGEVVVISDDFIQLFERDVAAISWQYPMVGERVQCRAGASTILVGWWGVLWPAPSADGDLSRRSLGGDQVEQRETKVGLEEEEDFDEVSELTTIRRLVARKVEEGVGGDGLGGDGLDVAGAGVGNQGSAHLLGGGEAAVAAEQLGSNPGHVGRGHGGARDGVV